MISRIARAAARPLSKSATGWNATRSMSQLGDIQRGNAKSAWERSCYFNISYTISEDKTVFEAVQLFSAFNIGCLVTTDANGKISGVISERDYVSKIALLGRSSKDTKIKEIATQEKNLVTAKQTDTLNDCMQLMLSRDIRHLPLINDEGNVDGMLSIKDLIKVLLADKDQAIDALSNLALGKGGHFVAD
eukprot:g3888.t1